MQKIKQTIPFLLLTSALLLGVLTAFQPTDTNAQGMPLPTATPLGTPPPPPLPSAPTTPPGATIILLVENAPNAWTAVQWQDTNDNWHTVEGWQSSLTDGYVGWYVAPEDFDTGPFRWVVYDEEGGTVIGTTENIDLPKTYNLRELTTITIN